MRCRRLRGVFKGGSGPGFWDLSLQARDNGECDEGGCSDYNHIVVVLNTSRVELTAGSSLSVQLLLAPLLARLNSSNLALSESLSAHQHCKPVCAHELQYNKCHAVQIN